MQILRIFRSFSCDLARKETTITDSDPPRTFPAYDGIQNAEHVPRSGFIQDGLMYFGRPINYAADDKIAVMLATRIGKAQARIDDAITAGAEYIATSKMHTIHCPRACPSRHSRPSRSRPVHAPASARCARQHVHPIDVPYRSRGCGASSSSMPYLLRGYRGTGPATASASDHSSREPAS